MKRMGKPGKPVRLGIVGVGARGMGQLSTLLDMEDVIVPVICDNYPDRVEKGRKLVAEKRDGVMPDGTPDYREVAARDDLDAVVVMTSWTSHIKIAVECLDNGKWVALEVGGASSIEECWSLVRASEQNRKPCMLLENCCYGQAEMAILNMVKKGLFGEIVHCQGGYQHDLREEIGKGDIYRHYRLENFLHRNGELYPTHEIGPIAKELNLNRGNRMLTLCSMASKAVGLEAWLKEHRKDSPLASRRVNAGDIVTTMIKCANGETILLTHDCTLPRPYSRGHRIQGTKGIWMEDMRSIYIEGRSPARPGDWSHPWESDKAAMEEFEHPLWKAYRQFGPRGGHDGMDYLVLRAFIESLQNNVEPPIDVYDTAAWMAITCLSEQSVAMGGAPVPVPDFTNGEWIWRGPGNTGIYSLDIIPE
ncbi:MAG: Gfo/Idh/MocA family protein [Kiritimatiellia bacterium]|jgi:hypothetical protein